MNFYSLRVSFSITLEPKNSADFIKNDFSGNIQNQGAASKSSDQASSEETGQDQDLEINP